MMSEDWEAAYCSAMLETDPQKLAVKIDSATVLLQACLSALNSAPESIQQRTRIQDALRTLDAARRLELGTCA
jgi:hypothetical protein